MQQHKTNTERREHMAEKNSDAAVERARREAEVGSTAPEHTPERPGESATASDLHRNGPVPAK
jgi:hypothetical protein